MIRSLRKENIRKHSDQFAESRDQWRQKNRFFYDDDISYMRFLVYEGQKVLELGCGTGHLLGGLNPSYGVGVDISEKMIEKAKSNYPNLTFLQGDLEDPEFIASLGGTFDIVILSDTLGYLDDCEKAFSGLHSVCGPETRLIISDYAWFWEPILSSAEKIHLKMPSVEMNWLSTEDTRGFLHLAGFEVVKREWRQLIPRKLFGIGSLVNRFIAKLYCCAAFV